VPDVVINVVLIIYNFLLSGSDTDIIDLNYIKRNGNENVFYLRAKSFLVIILKKTPFLVRSFTGSLFRNYAKIRVRVTNLMKVQV